MKVILIGSFPVSHQIYHYLSKNNYLHGVCFQEFEIQHTQDDFWVKSVQNEGVDTFLINKDNINQTFKTWLEDKTPDLILVCGFSLKISKDLLSIPRYGFLNIHFGKLPENRGPNPLFWSIKRGERQTAITIHQMDKNWDTGKILIEQPVPIIPGETLGMVHSKMSNMLEELTKQALVLVISPSNFKSQLATHAVYNNRPKAHDMYIDWEQQTADDIEQLINACNPKYGGATTYYQGTPIKIMEVSPVDSQPILGKTPGQIVHAHPQEGLFVYCKYGKLLKVNIISSDAGILSGTKYVHLGIQPGQYFTTPLKTTW